MTKKTRHNILIALAALALIAAVVVYIIFPLHQEKINREAVAAEAATYYNEQFSNSDSITEMRARQIVEGVGNEEN